MSLKHCKLSFFSSHSSLALSMQAFVRSLTQRSLAHTDSPVALPLLMHMHDKNKKKKKALYNHTTKTKNAVI